MKTEGTWTRFILKEKKGKTDVWNIETKDGKSLLGQIKWYERWEKYTLFPSNFIICENKCLWEILEFLDELMPKTEESKDEKVTT